MLGNIFVRAVLSLPISPLLGLYVNIVMLFLWVLLLCTYTSWMWYKRQLRNCVRLYFNPCYLFARPVPLAYCAGFPLSVTTPGLLPHPYLCHTPHHLQYVIDDPLLLQSSVKHDSLDLFINSFLGKIPSIW